MGLSQRNRVHSEVRCRDIADRDCSARVVVPHAEKVVASRLRAVPVDKACLIDVENGRVRAPPALRLPPGRRVLPARSATWPSALRRQPRRSVLPGARSRRESFTSRGGRAPSPCSTRLGEPSFARRTNQLPSSAGTHSADGRGANGSAGFLQGLDVPARRRPDPVRPVRRAGLVVHVLWIGLVVAALVVLLHLMPPSRRYPHLRVYAVFHAADTGR